MITEKKLIKGIETTIDNANSLFFDANCLLEKESYPRAYTLFHLSLEEIGRFNLLVIGLLEIYKGNKFSFRNLKSLGYNDHISKLKGSLRIEAAILYIHSFGEKLEEVKELWDELNKKFDKIGRDNELKNQGLYVTYKQNNFKNPKDEINEKMCLEIKEEATARISFMKLIFGFMKESKEAFVDAYKTHSHSSKLTAIS